MSNFINVIEQYTTIQSAIAAVDGAVNGQAWNTLVQTVVPTQGATLETVTATINAGEAEWDAMLAATNQPKSKPGKYRSAKSVVLKAMEKGVALYNADGSVRGKTEVEKDCKEEKSDAARVDDAIEAIRKCMDRAYVLTTAQKDALAALLV
jgi:hypothetical protein